VHTLPPIGGHSPGTAYGALPLIFVNGRVSFAASLSLVAVRAAILFTIAACAFGLLRTRLFSHSV
jgi:hypothetical protein